MRNNTVSTGAAKKAGVGLVCLDGNADTDFRVFIEKTDVTPHVDGPVQVDVEPKTPTHDTKQD